MIQLKSMESVEIDGAVLDPQNYLPRDYNWIPFPVGSNKMVFEYDQPVLYGLLSRCCGNYAVFNVMNSNDKYAEWQTFYVETHCTAWLYVGRWVTTDLNLRVFEIHKVFMADC